MKPTARLNLLLHGHRGGIVRALSFIT